MNYLKRIGWGALIWVIMFMWVTVLMFVFKLSSDWFAYALTWLGAIVLVWIISGFAKIKTISDAFLAGVIFVVVGLILDWLVTRQFNAEILSSWTLWVGYAITLLTPVIRKMFTK